MPSHWGLGFNMWVWSNANMESSSLFSTLTQAFTEPHIAALRNSRSFPSKNVCSSLTLQHWTSNYHLWSLSTHLLKSMSPWFHKWPWHCILGMSFFGISSNVHLFTRLLIQQIFKEHLPGAKPHSRCGNKPANTTVTISALRGLTLWRP